MKKLLNILVLASALFLTACGPSYDFSSPKALGESLAEQAVKENLKMEEASTILSAYLISETLKNWKDIIPEALEVEDGKALEETTLALLKHSLNGKTFEDMKDDTAPVVFELVEVGFASAMGDNSKLEKMIKSLDSLYKPFGLSADDVMMLMEGNSSYYEEDSYDYDYSY